MAFSPEVEKLGLVLPNLKAPYGLPKRPQPFGSCASERTSDQPSGVSGQPRVSAIGLGMAMTSGVRAIEGRAAPPTRSGASRAVVRWRSRPVQELAAGDHTSGRGPSTRSSQPRPSASVAPPLALLVTTTRAHLPPASPSVSA